MSIKFKPAEESDCELLFIWVNDHYVRENAFNSNKIEYEEHKSWFEKRLKSDKTYIFISYMEEVPIGQIRIDLNDNVGIIDYSIDSVWRGKGYGTLLLTEIGPFAKNKGLSITKLIGKVKYTNKISQKAFIKAGYFQKYNVDYIEYWIDLKQENEFKSI